MHCKSKLSPIYSSMMEILYSIYGQTYLLKAWEVLVAKCTAHWNSSIHRFCNMCLCWGSPSRRTAANPTVSPNCAWGQLKAIQSKTGGHWRQTFSTCQGQDDQNKSNQRIDQRVQPNQLIECHRLALSLSFQLFNFESVTFPIFSLFFFMFPIVSRFPSTASKGEIFSPPPQLFIHHAAWNAVSLFATV